MQSVNSSQRRNELLGARAQPFQDLLAGCLRFRIIRPNQEREHRKSCDGLFAGPGIRKCYPLCPASGRCSSSVQVTSQHLAGLWRLAHLEVGPVAIVVIPSQIGRRSQAPCFSRLLFALGPWVVARISAYAIRKASDGATRCLSAPCDAHYIRLLSLSSTSEVSSFQIRCGDSQAAVSWMQCSPRHVAAELGRVVVDKYFAPRKVKIEGQCFEVTLGKDVRMP